MERTNVEIRVTKKTVMEWLAGLAKGFFVASGVVTMLEVIARIG